MTFWPDFMKYTLGGILVVLATLLLPSRSAAQGPADARFDLTRNGVIDDADAGVIVSAIARLQEEGQCITPELADRDLNGDGCVDIFDLQLLLAHWGERTRPEPAAPEIAPLATPIFTVNSSDTGADANLNDGVCDTGRTIRVGSSNVTECTLRAAIEQSNNRPGPETIHFNIRNSDGSCPSRVTIFSGSDLDLVIDAPDNAGVVIDGYSQCGASPNTRQVDGNADIRVQIEGASGTEGLSIYSANNTVKGLALFGAKFNLFIRGSNAHHNFIQGNILGNNASLNRSGSYGYGLYLTYRANHNRIGGDRPQDRNIIGGSSDDSVALTGRPAPVQFNILTGNYIGVKQDGKSFAGNTADGLDISEGAIGNWVGASPPGEWPPPGWQEGDPLPPPDPNRSYNPAERNVIGGNRRDGVEISHGTHTRYNYIVNNYIGLSASGNEAAPNGTSGEGGNGISFEDLINHNFVSRNVIANNGSNGIRGYVTNYNQITHNLIGVGPDGRTPMPNGTNDPQQKGQRGVFFFHGSKYNLIKNNTIAYQPQHGVLLTRQTSYLENSNEDPAYKDSRTYYNTISQNNIFHNGQAGIRLLDGANQNIAKPTITSALLSNTGIIEVSGVGCNNCQIEVFKAVADDDGYDNKGGEGQAFLNQATAAGNGQFSLIVSGVQGGDLVTATATDAAGNTSEFAQNVEVIDGQKPSGGLLLNGGDDHTSAYRTVLAQFVARDDTSVTGWRYRVNNPSLPGWSPVPSPGPSVAWNEVLTLSEGSHTVYVQYRDNDNLASAVYQASITVVPLGDPDNPDNSSLTINGGAAVTNDPNLALELIGPLYTAEMEVSDGAENLNGANWEPYAVNSSWWLNDPAAGAQSFGYTVYARFKGPYGNITPITSDTILYDPVEPVAAATFNAGTRALNLSGSRDDPGGSGLGTMRITGSPGYDSGWIAFAPTFNWPGQNGPIYFQVRDNAGNLSPMVSTAATDRPVYQYTYLPVVIR